VAQAGSDGTLGVGTNASQPALHKAMVNGGNLVQPNQRRSFETGSAKLRVLRSEWVLGGIRRAAWCAAGRRLVMKPRGHENEDDVVSAHC